MFSTLPALQQSWEAAAAGCEHEEIATLIKKGTWHLSCVVLTSVVCLLQIICVSCRFTYVQAGGLSLASSFWHPMASLVSLLP